MLVMLMRMMMLIMMIYGMGKMHVEGGEEGLER
jgi:hypothetical protein